MKSTKEQFYSLLREAMFANRLTAADISAAKGVHYTYVYNSIRNTANLTMQTAEQLAAAAGYRLVVSFEKIDPSRADLIGNMDAVGPIYSERRSKTKPAIETKESAVEVTVTDGAALSLDAEIDALLADGPSA